MNVKEVRQKLVCTSVALVELIALAFAVGGVDVSSVFADQNTGNGGGGLPPCSGEMTPNEILGQPEGSNLFVGQTAINWMCSGGWGESTLGNVSGVSPGTNPFSGSLTAPDWK